MPDGSAAPPTSPWSELAAERASAAAALVLDRLDFGFPDASRIDAALRLGRVDPESRGGNDDVR